MKAIQFSSAQQIAGARAAMQPKCSKAAPRGQNLPTWSDGAWFGKGHHPRTDTAQDIHLLALQPGPAKQVAQARHEALWFRGIKETDRDQSRFEMGVKPLDLIVGRVD
jgi:hypothetical protein